MSPSRLDIVFHGRVQGVGFRARAAAAAVRSGVRGWVRNEPDGTVKCVAEGESVSNSAFLESLLHDMSRYIESYEAIPDTFTGEFSSFEVRY